MNEQSRELPTGFETPGDGIEFQGALPPDLLSLLNIAGMGPRRTRLVWQELGITSVDELAGAASAGQLHKIKGIGPVIEQKILESIRAWQRQRSERIPLGMAWPLMNDMLDALRAVPGVCAAEPVGSLRRMRETLGDLGLLVATKAAESVIARFCALPMVEAVVETGSDHAAICTSDGVQVDLRIVPPERWGSALQYLTGSHMHILHLNAIAREQGLKLSEYGFHRLGDEDSPPIRVCAEEAEVYTTLGLPWITPELREDRGEVTAALEGHLPCVVTRRDLQGDFQCHTTFSDGEDSLEAMAEAARVAGLRYVIVTDHAGHDGLRPETCDALLAEVARVNRRFGGEFRVIAGVEVGIQADGTLEWPDEALARMEFVIASCRTDFGLPQAQMTARLLAALRHPYVDMIGHPSGRFLGKRESSALDMEAILQAAAEYGVALEINAWPQRLDLSDMDVRRATALGVPLAISSSAHDRDGFAVLEFGVAMARRGWVEARHLLNTRSADEILEWRRRRLLCHSGKI
jgi:DNA polymerase (family 10)